MDRVNCSDKRTKMEYSKPMHRSSAELSLTSKSVHSILSGDI